jgi:hypothetical protein
MRDVDTLRAIACHGAFSYGAACEALGGYLGSVDKFLNRENCFFGIPVFGFAL